MFSLELTTTVYDCITAIRRWVVDINELFMHMIFIM